MRSIRERRDAAPARRVCCEATMLKPSLGLVAGIGPSAGFYYYKKLVRAFGGVRSRQSFVLAHGDVATVRAFLAADDPNGLAQYIASLIHILDNANCDLVAIAATTVHLCLPQLTTLARLPIISLLDAARSGLLSSGARRVALFGTRQTMESDLFGALRDIEVVQPEAAQITTIADIYARTVDRCGVSQDDLSALEGIAGTLFRRDAIDAVVVAGTDFSEAFHSRPPHYPFIDISDLHIAAICERVFS